MTDSTQPLDLTALHDEAKRVSDVATQAQQRVMFCAERWYQHQGAEDTDALVAATRAYVLAVDHENDAWNAYSQRHQQTAAALLFGGSPDEYDPVDEAGEVLIVSEDT